MVAETHRLSRQFGIHRFLLVLASILCVGCTLPISLADPEFYRCHSMDGENRDHVGLIGHVTFGMSEASFVHAFQSHRLPGTKLVGPVTATDRLFGGAPQHFVSGVNEKLTFSHAFLIEDKSGCPLWRYFFDKGGLLVGADTMYHELGSFSFHPHSLRKWP